MRSMHGTRWCCWAAARAPYQDWSLAILAKRRGGRHRVLALQLPTAAAPVSVFTMGGFDPAQGSLSFLAEGRGLADCGRSGDWIWSEGTFRLVAVSRLDRCGGSDSGDFLTLHRSRPGR